jgi:hypothetical protein
MTVELADKEIVARRTIDEQLEETMLQPASEPEHEQIAAEAYARYLARGRADGGDVADWLEAEEALRQRRAALRT